MQNRAKRSAGALVGGEGLECREESSESRVDESRGPARAEGGGECGGLRWGNVNF